MFLWIPISLLLLQYCLWPEMTDEPRRACRLALASGSSPESGSFSFDRLPRYRCRSLWTREDRVHRIIRMCGRSMRVFAVIKSMCASFLHTAHQLWQQERLFTATDSSLLARLARPVDALSLAKQIVVGRKSYHASHDWIFVKS